MDDDEVIAHQAKRIATLEVENADLKGRIQGAIRNIVCVGGPMNDNARGYTKEQLAEWHQVLGALE